MARWLPDYGGINLILSVLEDSLLRGLLLVSSLLQLYLNRERGFSVMVLFLKQLLSYLIDLYLVKSIGEVFVVGKLVTVIYVFALWYLGQHPGLPASQRLQRKKLIELNSLSGDLLLPAVFSASLRPRCWSDL